MDPFEQARQRAAEIHAQAVGSGASPDLPLAIVKQAAAHLDLEISWVANNDPILNGGLAVFHPQPGIIFCSSEGTDGERALLAGHELGHAVLEVAPQCNGNIDASQSTESAPVGLQRVEDYGPRARHELRANVFARELVLPRSLARELHVGKELSSRKIAERLGLECATVRQQILDATLLPVWKEKSAVPEIPRTPSSAQIKAVNHRSKPFLLEAGPGTGKTATLVDHVGALIADKVDPGTILILTFSNKAAGELLERISRSFPNEAPRIWMGTFHAFGLEIVRRYHQKFGLSANPTLFDRSDSVEMLEELFPTLPLKQLINLWDPSYSLRDILTGISRAKDELLCPEQYRAEAESLAASAATKDEKTAAEKWCDVACVYAHYERLLRANDGVDFGDLIKLPAELLRNDATVRAQIQIQYRHVLVDEYQDVNRASAVLLKGIADTGERLWVVGDARQSIYRFRGASPTNMIHFEQDFAGAEIDALDVNFRSTTEIINAFSAFADEMPTARTLKLSAHRGANGSQPQFRSYETETDEAEGIADEIQSLNAAGIAWRDQAVLCRSNRRMAEIAQALENRGIPLLHLGSLFERDEIRDLLSLLALFTDRYGDTLVRVGNRYGLTLQDAHAATQRLQSEKIEQPAVTRLTELSELPTISQEGCNGLRRLAADLASTLPRDKPWDVMTTYLLDNTRLVASLADAKDVHERMKGIALWQFLNFARDLGPKKQGQPILRMLNRVRQLVHFSEDRDLRHVPQSALHLNGVRLMSVHGSKGLEFEAVHIPSLSAGTFPISAPSPGQPLPPSRETEEVRKQSRDDEEESLFFVALSRARSHLRITRVRKQRGGKNRSPSRFVARVEHCFETQEISARGAKNGIEFPPIQVTYTNNHRITWMMLKRYQRCPRRYFYTHAFGLRGSRRKTIFSRTHDVVHAFLDWLGVARTKPGFTPDFARCHFDTLWISGGHAEGPLGSEYRRLADELVSFALCSTDTLSVREPESLPISVLGAQVWMDNNFIGHNQSGVPVLQHLRSGRTRAKELSELEYDLELLSGKEKFGQTFELTSVQLSSRNLEPVPHRETSKAEATLKALLTALQGGLFPPEPSPRECPRCPHFFACGHVGAGDLEKKS